MPLPSVLNAFDRLRSASEMTGVVMLNHQVLVRNDQRAAARELGLLSHLEGASVERPVVAAAGSVADRQRAAGRQCRRYGTGSEGHHRDEEGEREAWALPDSPFIEAPA